MAECKRERGRDLCPAGPFKGASLGTPNLPLTLSPKGSVAFQQRHKLGTKPLTPGLCGMLQVQDIPLHYRTSVCNLLYDFGKHGHVCVCVGKTVWSCVPPGAQFASKNKILPNDFVCGLNCFQIKVFMNHCTTASTIILLKTS